MTIIKILIGIGLGFVVLVALIFGASLLFVHLTVDDDFRKAEDQSRLEGANFGKATDQIGCLNEGLKRSKNITLVSPFKDQVQLGVFVENCLPASRPTEDFCETVPADYDLLHVEDWKTEQCHRANLTEVSSGCGYVFEQQINFCSRKAD